MILTHVGDLFSTSLPAIGHGVNCQGLMGSGVAKIVRAKYPDIFPVYKRACDLKVLTPGGMLATPSENGKIILNIASQDQPGPDARLEWVRDSMEAAFTYCTENGVEGFAIPRIGAGIGGLVWRDVLTEIIAAKRAVGAGITLEIWTLPEAAQSSAFSRKR